MSDPNLEPIYEITERTEDLDQLAPALLEAQRKAQVVTKGARNRHQGYDYASAEAIIGEARAALNAACLVVLTLGWRALDDRVLVTYVIMHSSGQHLRCECSTPVLPGKGRPEDKAEFASITANLAYFLRGLLLLPRLDENAIDQRDDRPAPPVKTAPDRTTLIEEWRQRITEASPEEFQAIPAQIRQLGLTESERDQLVGVYAARNEQLRGAA